MAKTETWKPARLPSRIFQVNQATHSKMSSLSYTINPEAAQSQGVGAPTGSVSTTSTGKRPAPSSDVPVRVRKKRNCSEHFENFMRYTIVPGTGVGKRAMEAAQRAFKAADQRIIRLKTEIADLKKQVHSKKKASKCIVNYEATSGSVRSLKRAHINFKPIAIAADDYFKDLIYYQKELDLSELNKVVRNAGEEVVKMHTVLGASTHTQQNTRWKFDQKDSISVILMLAMRATGSQRTLKHFRQYFTKCVDFNVAKCWSPNPTNLVYKFENDGGNTGVFTQERNQIEEHPSINVVCNNVSLDDANAFVTL